MLWKVLSIMGLSTLSSILYRMGGAEKWNTKWRDIGVPIVGFCTMLILGVRAPWFIHLISWGAYFGALTTYWDIVFGDDNFYFHGFACAFAYVFYALYTEFWFPFIIRFLTCAFLIGGLNWAVNKWKVKKSDLVEELSRGFILTATMLLFLMGR